MDYARLLDPRIALVLCAACAASCSERTIDRHEPNATTQQPAPSRDPADTPHTQQAERIPASTDFALDNQPASQESQPPAPSLAPPPAIVVDGEFDDWNRDGIISVPDPAGDATGAFDITRVSAAAYGETLYLQLQLADTGTGWVNLQSGDVRDGTLILTLRHHDKELTIDTRARTATRDGDAVGWAGAGYWSIPTYAAPAYELRLDSASIGAAVGDTVELSISGSDALDEPVRVIINEPAKAEPVTPDQLHRAPGTSFRIANLNTLRDGLTSTDDGRAPRLGRLLAAVRADVYCFQEEWDNTAQDVAAALAQSGAAGSARVVWNVFKRGGTQIASIHPVNGFDTGESRFALAGVDLPSGPLLIASVHTKCCGYAGSPEDTQRIRQMDELIEAVNRVRESRMGDAALPYRDAPVIVVGDWNLVGSRTPLTRMEDAGYTQVPMPQLGGNTTATWVNEQSDFSPGRLDLGAYTGDTIKSARGYTLNTRVLPDDVLEAARLQPGDSAASDHLMLVMDVTVR